MLKQEKNYDFRKRIFTMHKPIRTSKSLPLGDSEYAFSSEATLELISQDPVAITAAKDFADFLKVAFKIKLKHNTPPKEY